MIKSLVVVDEEVINILIEKLNPNEKNNEISKKDVDNCVHIFFV